MTLENSDLSSFSSETPAAPNTSMSNFSKMLGIVVGVLVVGLLVTNIDLRGQIKDLKSEKSGNIALENTDLFDEPGDLKGFIARISDSIVTIRCEDGVGTGFAYEVDGVEPGFKTFVVTNHHVIEECIENPSGLLVTHGGSQEIKTEADLYGWDEENDLALVQIAADLQPLDEADDFAKPGEWTMAIGNPVEDGEILMNATTFGRIIFVRDEHYNYTSAVINGGNSGGPLVNSQGKLIGINSFGSINDEAGLWNIAVDSYKLCDTILECG